MIPKLYPSTETAFTSEGLGRLVDARKCEVTEERNGIYELVLEYPVGGDLFDSIKPGCYILATHDDTGDMQAFQIYKTSSPLDGWMTVNAWHISYLLNSIVVAPFTATTCANALAGIASNSMNTNPFTFMTDKTLTAPFSQDIPMSARSLLGGVQGSVLDVYGPGEYEFDMFSVKFLASRGANTNVVIRYGKNLKSLDYQLDASNMFNAVVPYWTNGETSVYVNHVVVRTGETANRVVALDLSSDFDEAPTTAQLEAKAQAYVDASTNYQVKDNIKVDFVPLWQTEEYKNYADLERVKLCDTVKIYYEKFGITATAKIIKVVYNTLLDRYKYIELGEPKATFAQEVTALVSDNIMGSVEGLVKRTAADAIPDASTTERGLMSTGDQEFAGQKTFPSPAVKQRTASAAAGIQFKTFDDLVNGLVSMNTYGGGGRYSLYRFIFTEYSLSSTTFKPLAYREAFRLPTPDWNRSSSVNYEIWTTKAIPEPPTTAGTYTLKATRSSNGVTYSWV